MLPLLLTLTLPSAPAPPERPSGAVVYNHREAGPALSFLTPAGGLVNRITGPDSGGTAGSSRRVAVDPARKCVWVCERGGRILKYSLEGKELLAVPDVKAAALAVDPATGNVWATRSFHIPGKADGGSTSVRSPEGKVLATHPVPGQDIAFDPKNKSMCVVGQEMIRLSLDGNVRARGRVTGSDHCLAVCPLTGNVWVATGATVTAERHLGLYDLNAKQQDHVPLGGIRCLRLAISPKDGSVWVALAYHEVRRYSKAGLLKACFKLEITSLDIDHATDGIWAVTPDEILRLTRDGKITLRVKHKGMSVQSWIASY